MLAVKQGTVVLQAAPSSFSDWPAFGSPTATYYVLKDQPALRSGEITDITPATDHTATPEVTFQLSTLGRYAFHLLTAQIAKRGATDSIGSAVLDQHFAVALNDQLLAVSPIDFKAYPDGITGAVPAAITGRFTTTTVQQLASEMQLGAMPVKLLLISGTPLAAHH
jgi:SecD/SecF fusion protein